LVIQYVIAPLLHALSLHDALPILSGRKRDVFLSIFGPLSLILLLALWAVGSVFSFGLLQWAAGSAMRVVGDGGGGAHGFWSDVRSEEHTSELQSLAYIVCRILLEK